MHCKIMCVMMILKKLLNWFHDTLYDHLVILDVIANSTYIYISVSVTCSITSALWLHSTLTFLVFNNQCVADTASRSSNDLETSKIDVNRSPSDHIASVSPTIFRQCIHGGLEHIKRLFNCNLTYIEPHAFADWPKIQVRKYTNIRNLSVFVV